MPVQDAFCTYLKDGAVLYDVGANVGFLTVIGARLVGSSGTVYAFEPVPENANLIRRNAEVNGLKQILVVEKAVASESGTAELVLAAYSGGASLASVGPPPDATGRIRVKAVTIDELVEQASYKAPSFVKIDVEGAELAVLRGMVGTLDHVRPIVLYELDDCSADALEGKRLACEELLCSHSYSVVELPPSYPGNTWLVKHFLATPV